jgi:uncharacterized protein YybS (DUF2232 family)
VERNKGTFQARSVTEGAIFAALFAVLVFLSMTVLGLLLIFVLGVPFVVLAHRRGFRTSLISAVTATILLALFMDPVSLFLAVMPAAVGLGLGFGLEKKWTPVKILLTGAITGGLSVLGSYMVQVWVLGVNVLAELKSAWASSLALVQNLTAAHPELYPPETIKPMLDMYAQVPDLAVKSAPYILFGTGMLLALTNVSMARYILRRTGTPLENWPRLSTWRFSRLWAFVYAGATLGLLLAPRFGIPLLELAFLNVFQISAIVLFISALLLVWAAGKRFHVPSFIVVLAILLFFFNPGLSQLLALVGLFDLLFDYRGLLQPREPVKEG